MSGFTPFYGPVDRRAALVLEAQMVETTTPGARASYAPTGKQRAHCFGVRIPVWVCRRLWTPAKAWTRFCQRCA